MRDHPRVRVTVWNEYVAERGGLEADREVLRHYPHGLHQVIAGGLREQLGEGAAVRTATLDEPHDGLPQALLDATDVLLWWGHTAHERVADQTAARVRRRVLAGMGLLVLHSAHLAKVFTGLLGTGCTLRWREGGDRELVWTVAPAHPIAAGVPHPLVIEPQEMYGEFFDIPAPDELVFVSSFSGGEVFRSGCCFHRGSGRIFYFSPGHESYPVYHLPGVRRVLANAVRWAHHPAPAPLALEDCVESPTGWFERDRLERVEGGRGAQPTPEGASG
jgi:trehalose utilization protein